LGCADIFAATPPLKAARLGLALTVSLGSDFLACLYDVSVALHHATLDELVHIIPPKGEEEDGYVRQLRWALYGSRRASFLFQPYVMDTMKEAGFVRHGVACQALWRPERRIFVMSTTTTSWRQFAVQTPTGSTISLTGRC
jgi:hypothetical protein